MRRSAKLLRSGALLIGTATNAEPATIPGLQCITPLRFVLHSARQ
jgi:hypothetical protein